MQKQSGSVWLNDKIGNTIEAIQLTISEYYNKEAGTTPQLFGLQIYNPVQKANDHFYFLKEENYLVFNSIKTDEETMPLIELYMQLMSKEQITCHEFLSEVLTQYFIKQGYSLVGNDVRK